MTASPWHLPNVLQNSFQIASALVRCGPGGQAALTRQAWDDKDKASTLVFVWLELLKTGVLWVNTPSEWLHNCRVPSVGIYIQNVRSQTKCWESDKMLGVKQNVRSQTKYWESVKMSESEIFWESYKKWRESYQIWRESDKISEIGQNIRLKTFSEIWKNVGGRAKFWESDKIWGLGQNLGRLTKCGELDKISSYY